MSLSSLVSRLRYLSLIGLLSLIPVLAFAATVTPEKSEIEVGETMRVSLKGTPLLAIVRWEVSPELELLDSDNKGATVKGKSAGTGTVTMKLNLSSKTTRIVIKDGPGDGDKPDDKAAVKMEGMVRALGVPDAQVRIARLLYEVTNEIRGADSFYAELNKLGGKMTDVIALRSKLVDMPDSALARQIMGPTYPEGGTLVEQRILTWRKNQSLEAIKDVLAKFAGRVPADGAKLMVSHVGKWANQDSRSLQFPGDIDFSFVSNDIALVEAMKAEFLDVIKRRTKLDQFSLDSVCTAHGKAGLEVYIGRHGMAFAEEQMKINFVIDLEKGTTKPADLKEAAHILTSERALLEAQGKEPIKPVLDTEPGLSMEMVRHFDHDIAKSGIFDVTNAVVKAAKYLDRSYKSLDKAGGQPADPKLAAFAKQITEWANTKPQTAQIREDMIRLISEHLGSPPRTLFDADTKKLVLTLDAGTIKAFHESASKAMWKTVEQGSRKRTEEMDNRLRDLEERARRGDDVAEDAAKLRKEMLELIDMVEAEISAFKDKNVIPTEVQTNNAKVKSLLERLAKRFGLKTLSPEELKDKKFVEELLKAEGAAHSKARKEMLMAYIMDRSVRGAELAIKGTEKINQILDIIDDNLLGNLRGDGDWDAFEAEVKAIKEAAYDPQQKPGLLGRVGALKNTVAVRIKGANMYLNEKIQGTAAGRQGVKLVMIYGLVDEMKSYRDAFNEQGWGGLGMEIIKRRVPFSSSVENVVMGNNLRAGWDVVTTLIPPLALPEAAWGIGEGIGLQVKSTYWSEQLALFVDTLYADAKFKLEKVEAYEAAKVGDYRLISVKYRASTVDLSQFAEMRKAQVEALRQSVGTREGIDWGAYQREFRGITEWADVDATLKNNLAASDPVLQMLEEMINHPAVGPIMADRLAQKGLARWEQVKLGFITNLIKRLEDRKQADSAQAAGMLPFLFEELRKIAADLGIEDEVLAGLDAEVDTNNLKSLIKWAWDVKRGALGQAPTESEATRAAQVVKKYLDSYKVIRDIRDSVAKDLPAGAAKDGVERYLSGPLFLSGRADPDMAAARAWYQHAQSAGPSIAEQLLKIKREFADSAKLDAEDLKFQERAFTHELWMKPYKDAGTAKSRLSWLDTAIMHGKARNQILDEYREWLSKLALVELTVTVSGLPEGQSASGRLEPTDILGKAGGASGSPLVFVVPTGRYRLTVESSDCEAANKDILLGRALNAKPKESISLTCKKKDDANKPSCSYDYSAWGECNRATKKWTRTVTAKKPENCIERQKPVLEDRCNPPPTEEDKKNQYFNCLCRCSSGWDGSIGVWYDPEGKSIPECKSNGPCFGGAGAWGCTSRHFFAGPSDCAKGCWEAAFGKGSYDPAKADEMRKKENKKYKKPLTVKIKASKNPADFGDIVDLSAETSEGSGGYQWTWGGCAQDAKDASAKVLNSRECKPCQASVTATDQDGDSASDSLTIQCTALKVKLTKERPAENAIPVGGGAELFAEVFSGDKPANGSFFYLWEPNPDVLYGDPKNPKYETSGGSQSRHKATFQKLGGTPVWVTVLKDVGGRKQTMGESPQIMIDVVTPKLKLGISKATPLVGEKVVITVHEEPKMGDDLLSFWWEIAGDATNPGPEPNIANSRAYSFKPKNDKPVKVTVHAKSKQNGDELGQESLTVSAQKVTVNVTGPRIAGPTPQVWKEGVGLVPVERGVAEGQRVEFTAVVTPDPGDLRYQWTMTPDGCSLHAPASKETGVTCSNTGGYALNVAVKNADGAELGSGTGSLSVNVSQNDVSTGKNKAEAAKLLDQAKQLWGQKKYDEAIAKAEAAAAIDKTMAAPTLAQFSRDLTKLAWDALNKGDHQTAVKQLEQAVRLDPNNQDARKKLEQAKDHAAKWPQVEAKVKAFDTYIADKKVWSAHRTMLEMQDILRTLAAGQSANNPTWKKVNDDLNKALQEYNRFSQEKSELHTKYFKEENYEAMLRNAEDMLTRELSPSDAKEAQSRIEFAKRFLGAADLGKQADAFIRNGQYSQALDAIRKGREIHPKSVEGVAKTLAETTKRLGKEAETRRDFKTAGSLFGIAKEATPQDNDAHIGANNAPVYQKRVDEVRAWQREVEGHIANQDWDKAEFRLDDIKRWEETIPGEMFPETRSLIERVAKGYTEYKAWALKQKEYVMEAFTARCVDEAQARLTKMRASHLIWQDQDWTRVVQDAINQAKAECSLGGVPLENCGRTCGVKGVGAGTQTGGVTSGTGALVGGAGGVVSGGLGQADMTQPVSGSGNGATLSLATDAVEPGSQFKLQWSAPGNLPENAWIGMIPADKPHGKTSVNDQYDLTYQYLGKARSGVMTFIAPNVAGRYDLRMSNPADDRELASVTFTVKVSGTSAKISLLKARYAPNEPVKLSFMASTGYPRNTWVGLIPSDKPHGKTSVNDQYDLAYFYVDGRAQGEMTFTAPQNEGSYDLRMNETSNDTEVASVTFAVAVPVEGAELSLAKAAYKPAEEIRLRFKVSALLPKNSWVGLIPSSAPRGKTSVNDQHDVAYQYVDGRASGEMVFRAPDKEGSWDFRLNETTNDKEVISLTFRVEKGAAASGAPIKSTTGAAPSTGIVSGGQGAATVAGGVSGTGNAAGNNAALLGTWSINANSYTGKVEFSESGGQLKGRVWYDAHRTWEDFQGITFDGRTLRFLRPGPKQWYTGTLSGSTIKGTFDQGGAGSYLWTITRTGAVATGAVATAGTVTIEEFAWLGMNEDRVGEGGNGKPNGVNDGHFRLTLNLPAKTRIATLSVWSADAAGNKAGGQIWHSQYGGYWILGIFQGGRQLHTSHVENVGEFQGLTTFDLYANNSGYFNEGQYVLVEVSSADGHVLTRLARIGTAGMSAPGGRDYTSNTPDGRDYTSAAKAATSAGSTNLARGRPASQSSTSQWSRANDAQGAVDGIINGSYSFHTDKQTNPWWQVDLGGATRIDEVRVYNRLDAVPERARTLRILLSDDGSQWRLAYQHDGGVFGGKDGKPLKVLLNGVSARFVRLQLNESNWFHLDEVEVYGEMLGGR